MYKFEHQTYVDENVENTFSWFEHEGSFRRLMPPWEVLKEIKADKSINEGSIRIFKIPFGPFKMSWVAKHTIYNPPNQFKDIMLKGPFWRWEHVHDFIPQENGTLVKDTVEYQVPLGVFGYFFAGRSVKKRIKNMFISRELRLKRDLENHKIFRSEKRKKILVAGSSGMIGTQLVAFLDTGGHDVWRLVRRETNLDSKEIKWDPEKNELDSDKIEGFDAIIHLGGAGIGDKRWTKKRKNLIQKSRENTTTLLSETISKLKNKPEVFLIASAIGYYGNRGDEELTEKSNPGEGFLTETVLAWEKYAEAAKKVGVRVINIRTGIVLSATGGALNKMLLPWKLGAGGPIGGGKQWMSWISLDDQIFAINHLIMNKECNGAYNLTSMNPVRQKEFSKTLGKVLRRPAFAPIPKFPMRILFGELAGPLLFEGQKVLPERLLKSGFKFTHENLENALRDCLGKWR
ncbi:MAG: TIGR01777 family protein [Euryarchaeota archaeon]|nr:TIGR01777 family protein [Euryarchaeota archaeon]|tara:strand:- start:2368 stop:3744 length:1377 start_codon:yes stop_codon:yes gene_type:complete